MFKFKLLILLFFIQVIYVSADDAQNNNANITERQPKTHTLNHGHYGQSYGTGFAGGFSHGSGSGSAYPFKPPTTPAFSYSAKGYSQLTQQQQQRSRGGLCGGTAPYGCRNSRYRTFDGSCNNFNYPTWGMANTLYARLLPNNYADKVHRPPVSRSGKSLPLAREVSHIIFPPLDIRDRRWTLVTMQWGQIITHDMALLDGTTQTLPHPTRCCTDDGQFIPSAVSSPLCYPIIILKDDPDYGRTGQTCHNFVRSSTTLDKGCTYQNEPAEQVSKVTSYMDLSVVYGNSENDVANLRARRGGRLRVDFRSGREWLPQTTNKAGICDVRSEAEICYAAGDTRANQSPGLIILQLMLAREHNRIADALAKLNPQWNDETIFQEARRIVTAEHQHISYYEWLPIFIGFENSYRRGILHRTNNYVNDYNPAVDPSVINEHSTAAFRYFHSQIAGRLQLVNEGRNSFSFASLRLSDHFNRPAVIEQGNNLDELTRGMATQPQENTDQHFDQEISRYLFKSNRPLGSDLRAMDIQRGRDHGLATYNSYRQYCGLRRADRWNDFGDYISPDNIQRLARLYESPEDVELSVGGALEAHVPGTIAGPTFLCILTEQFYRTRVGDRYWYENGRDPNTAFTLEQLNEIRKSSISRLFCDNGDNIKFMQRKGFELISGNNPVVSCNNIPAINLRYWKTRDTGPNYYSQYSPFNYQGK